MEPDTSWNSLKGDHDRLTVVKITAIKGREIWDGDNRVTA